MNFPFEAEHSVKEYIKQKFTQQGISSIEEIVQFLKDKGFSQLETVFLLKSELGLPFGEANGYVYLSKCWNGGSVSK